MGPLSYILAFVCIAIAIYFWYANNRMKAEVKDSSRFNTSQTKSSTQSSQKFLDFDADCEIRSLVPSDLDTIKQLVQSDGGCAYFLAHSIAPFLSESNKQCLGFGVEHKESKKIICTQFIMLVDDNETGLVLGAMIDPSFKSDARIMYMRLSNEIQSGLSLTFDNLGKYRSIEIASQPSYLNNAALDWKIKFNLDEMSSENVYCLLTDKLSDTEDGVKVNGDFKETDDISQVMDLLQKKFKVDNVLMDSKIYQTRYFEKELSTAFKDKNVSILMNKSQSCLCLVYANDDYYVYGVDGKSVASGVRYAQSRSAPDNVGGIYVSKVFVDGYEDLKNIFAKALENTVVCLDYDLHIDGH